MQWCDQYWNWCFDWFESWSVTFHGCINMCQVRTTGEGLLVRLFRTHRFSLLSLACCLFFLHTTTARNTATDSAANIITTTMLIPVIIQIINVFDSVLHSVTWSELWAKFHGDFVEIYLVTERALIREEMLKLQAKMRVQKLDQMMNELCWYSDEPTLEQIELPNYT